MEEAKNINKSLSTLGQVINHLTDGKSTHIPYRQHPRHTHLALIRQLQGLEAHSPASRVPRREFKNLPSPELFRVLCKRPDVWLARLNVLLLQYNQDETLSTLRFGQRAKRIKNVAKVTFVMCVRDAHDV